MKIKINQTPIKTNTATRNSLKKTKSTSTHREALFVQFLLHAHSLHNYNMRQTTRLDNEIEPKPIFAYFRKHTYCSHNICSAMVYAFPFKRG